LHRDGLDVLVHPLTEDAVEDHTDFAMWLGKPIELKLHTLPHGQERSAGRARGPDARDPRP
jgi:DOPA 4,5-dioxygenase